MPSTPISLVLAAISTAVSPPDPYAPPPAARTPERLAWNAIRGVAGADAAIERWLSRNPSAPRATRAMLAAQLCADYTRTIVGPRRVAACAIDAALDPDGDDSSLRVARLLQDAPPLYVAGSATVPMILSPRLRARSIPATVNGISAQWFIDVGAGMTTMTESDARRFGVRKLGGAITAETATKIKPVGCVGMIDRMTIGGATVEHMPVYVLPDDALTFDGHVASPILGLPVIAAFGRVAWLDNGRRMALGIAAPQPVSRKIRLYWHHDGVGIPIDLPGDTVGADFDSGAGDTTLYTPGFALLRADQTAKVVTRDVQVGGAGGFEALRLKTIDQFEFRIGGIPIVVRRANVEERNDRGAARIGNDMIDQLGSFVLDFTTMTLSAKR